MFVFDRELAELHRTSAVQDNRAQEAALSAEMQVREELKLTIEKQQQQHKWEKDSLIMQVNTWLRRAFRVKHIDFYYHFLAQHAQDDHL